MDESGGRFSVDRSFLNSRQWLSEPFTFGQAWIDIIGRARWKDGTLLLRNGSDDSKYRTALFEENVLQTRSPKTAKRLSVLIRGRLTGIEAPLWRLIEDGSVVEATHSCLAAAVKASFLLGDFLDLVVRDQYRTFKETLSLTLWDGYIEECRGRDPDMPQWSDSTIQRLRSSVYSVLAEAGYINSTKTRKLQGVHIVRPVLRYLQRHDEQFVLRCIQVGT